MSSLAFGQTTDDIRAKAKGILELRGGTTKDGSNMPSPAWVYRFFERHPDLTLRTPMSLGKERALVTPSKIEGWFKGLHDHLLSQDPSLLSDPTRIFNCDESGFSFDPKSRRVISWKGVKNVYTIVSNNRTQVTVLACMNAAGLYLAPLLIYPYKRTPGKNLLDGFPDALLQVSDNGWITSAIFFSWIPATRHIQKPLLLLVDGHVSHKSLTETSQICEDNQIILYCLPAHASHLVQPLDQAFFGAIKSAWSVATRRHIGETGDAVGLDTFAKEFGPVWQSCATTTNAESSYRAAGIYPFSPQRVLASSKMDPSQVFRGSQLSQPPLPTPPPTSYPLPTPSSTSSYPLPTPSSSVASQECSFTARQLEALRNFALFVTDDLGRNGFLRCFTALSTDAAESHEGYPHFQTLAASLKESFNVPVPTPSRAPLTLEDILKVPNFSGKGKQKMRRKAVPTMHYVLSGKEHREAIALKEDAQMREQKEKLVKRTEREEKTRKRKENVQLARMKREAAKMERKEKAAEAQRKRQHQKDMAALERIELVKTKRAQSESDDSGKDRNVEREMQETTREADEEEIDFEDVVEGGSQCKGCGEKEEDVEEL